MRLAGPRHQPVHRALVHRALADPLEEEQLHGREREAPVPEDGHRRLPLQDEVADVHLRQPVFRGELRKRSVESLAFERSVVVVDLRNVELRHERHQAHEPTPGGSLGGHPGEGGVATVLERIARYSYEKRWRMLAFWIVALILIGFLGSKAGGSYA